VRIVCTGGEPQQVSHSRAPPRARGAALGAVHSDLPCRVLVLLAFLTRRRGAALGAVHSDLPSRNPLAMMGAMVREKIERERERGLQDYLNAVLERCSDDQCLLLAKVMMSAVMTTQQ